MSSFENPRVIDPAESFNALVMWLQQLANKQNAPGFIVGISGTDSILTFLACAKAFEKLGEPERVMGVHFGPSWPPSAEDLQNVRNKIDTKVTDAQLTGALEKDLNFAWIARHVMPWLQQQAPTAKLLVNNSIDYDIDIRRWAELHITSINEPTNKRALAPDDKYNYWVVGTHNATEIGMSTYSNISMPVSVQPLIQLWKSEILEICNYLSVPQIALQKSCEADCECNRVANAAEHIREIDLILMVRQNILASRYLTDNIDAALLERLEAFVDKQIAAAKFKRDIPYKPGEETVKLSPVSLISNQPMVL